MKNYLSFGGGVNSVAMHLYLLEHGKGHGIDDFESIFVDHETDWPETYSYLAEFQDFLKRRGDRPVTVLKPDAGTIEKKRFANLYDYFHFKQTFPTRGQGAGHGRTCTHRFKITPIYKYVESPCFMLIGFDAGEAHRATINTHNGVENRYPLIEAGITRYGCKEIIDNWGLKQPMKSGCYICPFQTPHQYKELRTIHPDLFCKAEQLEKRYMERRTNEGKQPLFLVGNGRLKSVVEEDQLKLFKQDEYPPCNCML